MSYRHIFQTGMPARCVVLIAVAAALGCTEDPPTSGPDTRFADHDESIIELRLARLTPAAGYVRADLERFVPPGPAELYVARTAVITDNQIARVARTGSDPITWLHLELTPEGAERLCRVSTEREGELLATVLDSMVVRADRMPAGLGNTPLNIAELEHLPHDVAVHLARRISDLWPPLESVPWPELDMVHPVSSCTSSP